MKKCLAILAAVCLVTAAAVGGQYALSALPAPERPQTEDEALQQAFSPDLEQLASLGLEPFTSQLPVLMIDTGGQQLQKETVTWVDVAVLDDPSGENNILSAPTQVLTATLKYRGASSYAGFDKPQYRLEFYEDDREAELDYPLCGLGADSARVDLPMPGAPPMSTRDPWTAPPPSTRSSSARPVGKRISWSMDISETSLGAGTLPRARAGLPGPFPLGAAGCSTMVFHAPQAGHWPCHLGNSLPHWVQ